MSEGERIGKDLDLTNLDLDLLEQLLSEEGVSGAREVQGIRPRTPMARVPLSFSQELLWMLDQASPGLTAYNLATARRLIGPLDVPSLERSLTQIVARHESLRTHFGLVDGEPSQIIAAPGPVNFSFIELAADSAPEREAELERLLAARARTPFQLGNESLFRVAVVRRGPNDHIMLVETHHAVCDGWSIGLIMRELAQLYRANCRGIPTDLPPLAIQFGDYAIWQRETLQGQRLASLLEFWRGHLGDVTQPLALPTDFPSSPTPTFAGATVGRTMSSDLLGQVTALGREYDATLYMTLLAAYALVQHRYTGRTHVLIGSGAAGRSEHDTETMVGYLNNTLVQRVDFSGDPAFAELLTRVRDSALSAYDHQDVPLEKLMLEFRQDRQRVSDAPLFQTVFTMQDTIGDSLQLDDVDVQPFGVGLGATKFDITLLPSRREDGLRLSLSYRTDLFARATMDRFLGHLHRVLQAVVQDPTVRISALPMLTTDELADLAAFNATDVDEGASATVVGLIEEQARRVPDRTAIVCGPTELSYRDVNEGANRLARALRARGVVAGAVVGLVLDRSADAIVALLGILKAGASYAPTAPDLPPARLAAQLTESGVRMVVTTSEHAAKCPPQLETICLDGNAALQSQPGADPSVAVTPDDLAYVLFTSGSTGTPKGVAVTHANIVHYSRAVARVLGDLPAENRGDGFAALDGLHFGMGSTFAADLGNTSLFPALMSGGTLHILPAEVATNSARFSEYVSEYPLDVLKLTPSHLRALVGDARGAELAALLPSRWIVLGGEPLTLEFAETLVQARKPRVLNHYGPTETTVGVLTFPATGHSLARIRELGAQTVPLGRPLPNSKVFVVDARDVEVPIGVPGELLISGAGVAQGYLGLLDLTAERFFEFHGARTYRSGDRVRRLADGTIEFLGRTDDQVKIRGYRVELGEIAHALRAHPGVANGEVVTHRDAGGELHLVAYAVARKGYSASHADRPTTQNLAKWLADWLPPHMVPSSVVLLDEMPLTPNGKIDRARLPTADTAAASAHVAPRTDTEQRLAAIWSDVLKKPDIGITQNFVELGGHSLLAIRILGKISKTFGLRLSLRTLFDAPTIEKLSELIDVELQLAALDAMASEDAPDR